MAVLCSPCFAEDFKPKIATHLIPDNAEIEISTMRTASDQGRTLNIACGVITVRKDAHNYSTRTYAYIVDDDKLWLNGQEAWLKEPQRMGVVQVMKYCPGN